MKQSKRKQKSVPVKQQPEASVDAPKMQTVIEPPVAIQPKASESAFVLGASCTMREAAAIKTELMKLLKVEESVLLDVRAVERIDTSALQLLCAFVRDRRARRLATRWAGHPQVFSEALQILGLTQMLGFSV
jgi:ABC-type transporter Mla MlaB component